MAVTLDVSEPSHTERPSQPLGAAGMRTRRGWLHPVRVLPSEIQQIWVNESPSPINFAYPFKATSSSNLIALPAVEPADQLSVSCSAPQHPGPAVNDL